MDYKRQKRISRSLSVILRHKALKLNLPIDDEGYIPIEVLLKHNIFKQLQATLQDFEEVVKNDDKKRFSITENSIKANQGHTIPLKKPNLTPVTDPAQYPVVLHGTYFQVWSLIKATGLNKMERTHIHLAKGTFGEVTSGVRASAQVLIYIDLPQAIEEGLKFFESSNGVILCEGPISPKYFKYVIKSQDMKPFDPHFPDFLPIKLKP